PKLYYNLVLGLPSLRRTGIAGDWASLARRAAILARACARFLNLSGGSPLELVAAALWVVALTSFFVHGFRQMRRFVSGRAPRETALSITPLFFLPPIVLAVFSFSDLVTSAADARYGLVLLLPFAAAMGWAGSEALSRARSARARAAVVAGLLAVLSN